MDGSPNSATPVRRIAVIGVGLMGGSAALAAREYAGVSEVHGYDSDPRALDEGLKRGILTHAHDSAQDASAGADLVIVSTPPRSIAPLVAACLEAEPAPRVVTDMGSTKLGIVRALSSQSRRCFIGGHPICGAETAGLRFARADLFQRATYFLCPPKLALPESYDLVHSFVGLLGARPVAIGAEAHDRIMALVSHTPHVLANILMSEVGMLETGGRRALYSVGPSFKDLTRVAGANPQIWGDIFLENRDALLTSLRRVSAQINRFCDSLMKDDESGLLRSIKTAGAYREELLEYEDIRPDTLYQVMVRIPDEPGVLSRVMTALADAYINVEDLTLHHFSRDAGGNLLVYISGEDAAATAADLLTSLGFPSVLVSTGDVGE